MNGSWGCVAGWKLGRKLTENQSSIVNEGIRAILNLFIYFFLQEDFTRTKSTKSTKRKQATFFLLDVFIRIKTIKSIKTTKSTKRQTIDFLPLRCFYAHKNAVSFVSHTKKLKKYKNHKDANKQTSDFPHLRCFYAYKNAVFFVFVRLHAFCAFCACEIFW